MSICWVSETITASQSTFDSISPFMVITRVVTRLHTPLVSLLCTFCDSRHDLFLFTPDLIGSTLADPFLAYAGALYALAGPLHGFVHDTVSPVLQISSRVPQSGQSRGLAMAIKHAQGAGR